MEVKQGNITTHLDTNQTEYMYLSSPNVQGMLAKAGIFSLPVCCMNVSVS